jgi:predicted ester cyclase
MLVGNRDVLLRYVNAYNRGDLDALDSLVADDYVHHNGAASLTLAEFKQGARWIRAGLPDFTVELADLFGDGDRCVVRIVGRGTHDGSFRGESPTGRPVVMHGIIIYRFENGVIAEDWEAMDEGQLFAQISADADLVLGG